MTQRQGQEQIKGNKYLEGRVGLYMTVNDSREVERQVLDGGSEHHTGRV